MKPSLRLCVLLVLVISLVPIITTAAPVSELITETGYWTCPNNVFYIKAEFMQGGPGAMGGNSTMAGYAGTNSSLVTLEDYPVVPGQRYYLVVGAGGAGHNGYSYQPITDGNDRGTEGSPTYGFGLSMIDALSYRGTGGTLSIPHAINGDNGAFISDQLAQDGGAGYGNITYASYGGLGGKGYGASGGAGGLGGIGGFGGDGGNGAPGAIRITYDIDALPVMFNGVTYNAQSESALASVSISIKQGTTTKIYTSDGSGAYTINSDQGFTTGMSINMTFTKTGYYTTSFVITPYVSSIVPQNIGMVPTTFDKYAGGTYSGLIYDQFGSAIDSPTVYLTNSTSTISTTATTKGFFYFSLLPPNTNYNVRVNKTGYADVTSTLNIGSY